MYDQLYKEVQTTNQCFKAETAKLVDKKFLRKSVFFRIYDASAVLTIMQDIPSARCILRESNPGTVVHEPMS